MRARAPLAQPHLSATRRLANIPVSATIVMQGPRLAAGEHDRWRGRAATARELRTLAVAVGGGLQKSAGAGAPLSSSRGAGHPISRARPASAATADPAERCERGCEWT